MAVSRTKKGIPAVVVHPTYGAYSEDSKNTTEIHFCKEEKKIFVGDILYSSEKSCLCGSDTASTGGWYKLGQLECDSTAQVNVNVICSIMETYNSAYSGLFVLQARHEKSGSWSIKKLQWLARIGFSATAIKCVVDGNKAYLYAYKTTTQYSRLFVKVLCESGWNNRIPYLFLADNSTPESSTPGETTITECCAPTATTATNLASAPVIAAGTTSTNAITVTAGGKKSAEFTVPYATNAGSATSAGALAANSYINTHPEGSAIVIPFMNNDLAFLLKKGGSAIVKFDNTVVEKDISNVFDGTPSYWSGNNLSSLGYSSITIELTLHQTFSWSTKFYIDFGAYTWRAKTVKVEVINTNYADDVWTSKLNLTNNGSGHVTCRTDHTPVGASNNGGGFNKIRITLSDWHVPTDCRIAEIGLIGFNSRGLSETYLSRGGGSVYGNIVPFKNNTYNLGSDTNRWRNIYGTASNVTVASGSTDAYRAIVVHNGNTLYSAGTNTGKPRYNYATGDVMSKSFTTDGGDFNGNATTATTATKVSQVLRIKDAGSSGNGITYNGSSELGITVPTEMVGSMTGGGILLKVPSKAAIGLGNVDNTADANKSVKSATTATNLASAPVIAAGTTSTNAITVTAGGKKSAEFTVPYATKAGSATSATTATKVSNALTFDLAGQLPYDGSTPLTVVVPTDMIATASSGGFTFKRASKTFCAIVNTVVSATPFWKIKLTSYSDNFNGHAPQNGDTLFLWVKNTIASSTTAYPFCIPYSSAGESDNSKCIPLYHGQNTGTPKEWLGSTALSAGFYMFVFRSDVRGTSTAITTNGGWVFLYRNVSTT